MQTFIIILILLVAYLFGSIPFGLIIVKIGTGRDVRFMGSGRTGGTNAMRAAGFFAGALTAILDFSKAALAVGLAKQFLNPDLPWVEVFAGVAAVLGHNYSIFLPERTAAGRWHLRGGAGGGPALGGAFGLWYPSFLLIFPLVGLIFYFVGYASVTTISIAFFTTVLFVYRAAVGLSPWPYAAYGAITLVIVLWALRPNLKRLREGKERLHGFRANLKAKRSPDKSQN